MKKMFLAILDYLMQNKSYVMGIDYAKDIEDASCITVCEYNKRTDEWTIVRSDTFYLINERKLRREAERLAKKYNVLNISFSHAKK